MPVRSAVLWAVLFAAGGAMCGRAPSLIAAAPHCPAAWRPAWSADSSIALCLPQGFRAAGDSSLHHQRWERRPANSPVRDFLVVVAEPDSQSLLPPPALGSGADCRDDCATVDSVAVYRDTVGGAEAHIAVGLVSGGMPGFRRQPVIIAGWVTGRGVRVLSSGLATAPATLDTLRAMVRSVRAADRIRQRRDQSPNDR